MCIAEMHSGHSCKRWKQSRYKQQFTSTAIIHWRWADVGTVLCCVSGDSGTGNSDPPTPHYNSWILSDLTMQTQQHHIETVLGDSRSLRDGIILLKVWLHQRQLDIVWLVSFSCYSTSYTLLPWWIRKLILMLKNFSDFFLESTNIIAYMPLLQSLFG